MENLDCRNEVIDRQFRHYSVTVVDLRNYASDSYNILIFFLIQARFKSNFETKTMKLRKLSKNMSIESIYNRWGGCIFLLWLLLICVFSPFYPPHLRVKMIVSVETCLNINTSTIKRGCTLPRSLRHYQQLSRWLQLKAINSKLNKGSQSLTVACTRY